MAAINTISCEKEPHETQTVKAPPTPVSALFTAVTECRGCCVRCLVPGQTSGQDLRGGCCCCNSRACGDIAVHSSAACWSLLVHRVTELMLTLGTGVLFACGCLYRLLCLWQCVHAASCLFVLNCCFLMDYNLRPPLPLSFCRQGDASVMLIKLNWIGKEKPLHTKSSL